MRVYYTLYSWLDLGQFEFSSEGTFAVIESHEVRLLGSENLGMRGLSTKKRTRRGTKSPKERLVDTMNALLTLFTPHENRIINGIDSMLASCRVHRQ